MSCSNIAVTGCLQHFQYPSGRPVGRYRPWEEIKIGAELARGKFGTVFKGELEGEEIVIKEVRNAADDSDLFVREASMLNALDPHKNVVSYRGWTVQPAELSDRKCETHYLLMEYVSAFSVKRILLDDRRKSQDRKSLPNVTTIISLVTQIAAGMMHLHNQTPPVIHRDLACRNIMWHLLLQLAKIVDFGCARLKVSTDDVEEDKTGTWPVRWSAPETIRSGAYSQKTDVWSFGVTLWEIITEGATPYEGLADYEFHDVKKDVKRRIADGDNPGIPAVSERCSPDLQDLLRDCWKVNPDERPTMRQIYERLRKLQPKTKLILAEYSSGAA